jgi:hypothetical protein
MEATATVFKQNRMIESFGVKIIVRPSGFEITADERQENRLLVVEVYRSGRLLKRDAFESLRGWKDRDILNPAECGLRVLDMQGNCVAMLDVEEDWLPFLRPQGEQRHITESYVSVPPALTITDEGGSIWALAIGTSYAPKHKSPDGEFALPVLRNGVDTGEVASRIEKRGGKIKIFTCEGWKTFTGRSFF